MAERGSISLTYDGSLLCHLETALPQLEECGLKGTFYAEPAMLLENLPGWSLAALEGHEIGNGALHSAAQDDGSLPGWTLEMVADDVLEAKSLIDELFPGQGPHSFAFPWGRPISDGIDVSPAVNQIYPVSRSGEAGVNRSDLTIGYLKCVPCDGLNSEKLIEYAELAQEPGVWVVFAFDGIGGGERSIQSRSHRELCAHLAASDIEVAPVVEIGERVRAAMRSGYKLV